MMSEAINSIGTQASRLESVLEIIFFISRAKHMFWVLKRTVSMRQYF